MNLKKVSSKICGLRSCLSARHASFQYISDELCVPSPPHFDVLFKALDTPPKSILMVKGSTDNLLSGERNSRQMEVMRVASPQKRLFAAFGRSVKQVDIQEGLRDERTIFFLTQPPPHIDSVQEAVKTSNTVHLKAGFSTEIMMINWRTLEHNRGSFRTVQDKLKQSHKSFQQIKVFEISLSHDPKLNLTRL
ncbi:CLUMA_CG000792, isoform A [Clunio marinus]|uniref:CLUMA_CG000792, isoform A n=1 Tax=Clunio marinus TaxID=568069 RepID=A0A1J1HGI1_9DIPT|nr:CLUMA_CG000792, isoform A [Clunio marinus]